MIINSVSALSSFPHEVLQITLNPIDVAATQERLGLYFFNSNYDVGVERFSLDATYGLQSINPPYSTFTTPSCFVTLPDNFPVTWTVQSSDQYLYGSFSAGTSAFTVFPTHIHPKISVIDNHSITVSTGFLAPTVINDSITKEQFRQLNTNPSLIAPSSYGCQVLCTSAYYSALKKDYVAYYLQNPANTLQLQLDSNIIPESLSISFKTITALNMAPGTFWDYQGAAQYNQTYRWYNRIDPYTGSQGNNSFFVGLPLDLNFVASRTYDYTVWGSAANNTLLVGRQLEQTSSLYPTEGYNVLYPYVDPASNINYNTGLVNLALDNGVYISRNTPVHVTYQTRTSATDFTKFSINPTSPNVYTLSASESIYFSTFDFTTSSLAVTGKSYSGFSLHFKPDFTIYGSNLSSVQLSAHMVDNYFQNTFAVTEGTDKIRAKFQELSSDITLSARNLITNDLYRQGDWFPLNQPISLFNNHVANNHTVVFEISSFTGSYYYSDQFNFILNKNLASISFAISSLSDTQIYLNVSMFPNYDPNMNISWDIFPPENVRLSESIEFVSDASSFIPLYDPNFIPYLGEGPSVGVYQRGSQVMYNGTLYECTNAHYANAYYAPETGSGWTNAWKIGTIARSVSSAKPDWTTSVSYYTSNASDEVGVDLGGFQVYHNNVVYECINSNAPNYGVSVTVGGTEPGVSVGWNGFWKVLSVPPPSTTITNVPTNTLIPAGPLNVFVDRLGVDRTTLTLYSQEYDISGAVTWYPPVSSIWKNVGLTLTTDVRNVQGNVYDMNYINHVPISAWCVYNQLNYRVPLDAHISWKETLHNPKGIFRLQDWNRYNLTENVIYPGAYPNSHIVPIFSTIKTHNDPNLIPFNVDCNISQKYYNLTTDKLFNFRQYPDCNFSIILSADNGVYINSKNFVNTVFTATANAVLIADVAAISAIPSCINWTINNLHYSGLSVALPVISSICASVTAFDAKPYVGNFGLYNFEESMCVFLLTGIQPLDYISFPQYAYDPQIELTVNNYSVSSSGLTSYNVPCYTNSIVFSAAPGFDQYVFEVTNGPSLTSNSSLFYYPIDNTILSDYSASPINIKAFNQYFGVDDYITVYNQTSADDSSLYKQLLRFSDLPPFNASLSANNNKFFINRTMEYVDFEIVHDPFEIVSIDYDLMVNDGSKIYPVPLNDKQYITRFTSDPTRVLSIKENTDTSFTFFASGTVYKKLANSDMCPVAEQFTTNSLNISAFDYPSLDIYVNKNLLSSGELVHITTSFPQSRYYYTYKLDDGLGNIYSFTANTTITAQYLSAGTYSPSVTSFNRLYAPSSKKYNDLLVVKDSFENYNKDLFREIPTNITLPYNNIGIDADSWQFAKTFNDQIDKVFTNLDTLNNNDTIVNPDFPKYNIGWYGERRGVIKWRYDTSYQTEYQNYTFKNLKDLCVYNNTFITLRDNRIVFSNDDINMSEIFEVDRIPNAELFTNPTKILTWNDRLYLLDNTLKQVFVFTIDFNNQEVVLTHYWGGVGKKDSRTRLNNPTDFKMDSDGNLHVVDKDSGNIKIYNKYLNWTKSITLSDYGYSSLPIAVEFFQNNIYILTNDQKIIILDNNYNLLNILDNILGDGFIVPDNNSYRIITFTGNTLYFYYLNGLYLGSQTLNNVTQINSIKIKNQELYIVCDGIIIKGIDYLVTNSVLTENYTLSSWEVSACEIIADEMVSDVTYNDSFQKIYNNICNFRNDVTQKFVYEVDALGNFISQSILPINSSEIPTLTSLQLLGVNERVNYETINRNFSIIEDNLNALRGMLDVRVICVTSSDVIWTWDYHRISGPQFTSKIKNPYTWKELTKTQSVINPDISGITWGNISFVTPGVDNQFPICWVWEQMCCQCIHPVTWEDTLPGTRFTKSWSDLENNCCQQPYQVFDNCIDLC